MSGARDPREVKIQLARRQLGLDDDTYRAVLERVTGVRSSKGLSSGQIDAALAEFQRLGFQPAAGRKHSREPRSDLRLIFVLWRLLATAGHVRPGRGALNSFICSPNFAGKWGETPTDLRFLTLERAQDVIEALKDFCRRKGVPTERRR